MKRRLAYDLCCVIAALWALPHAAKAAGIATVLDVVNEGYRQPPGADEITARISDELVQNEALRTEKESVIHVKFVDGSELSVEQSSEMVLSDYVFDGSAAAGFIDLNEGLFHFSSNGRPDQNVKLRTPVATIGIRGTEFLVHVDGDDATIIDILDGSVEAVPNGAGKAAICVGGQSILISSENEDAQCGDIGSFATAAAPAANPTDTGQKHDSQDRERSIRATEPEPQARPEPPANPPDHGGLGEGGLGEGGLGEGGLGEGGLGEGGLGEGGQGEGGQGEGGQGEGGQGEGGQGEGGQGEGGAKSRRGDTQQGDTSAGEDGESGED